MTRRAGSLREAAAGGPRGGGRELALLRTTIGIAHFGQHDSAGDIVGRAEADLESRKPTVPQTTN